MTPTRELNIYDYKVFRKDGSAEHQGEITAHTMKDARKYIGEKFPRYPHSRIIVTKRVLTPNIPFGLTWRWHDESAGTRRIWRNDWPSDTFDIITKVQMEEIGRFCLRFSIPLKEAEDD